MSKKIITAGEKYNDIDALACAVAYSSFLNLQGIPNEVVFSGPLNESVTKSVKNFSFSYKDKLDGNTESFEYILVDISDHTNVSSFVPLNKVIEVYDHRWGFEEYWKSRPDVKTQIDTVGSCATLIWEKFKSNNIPDKIDPISANLLYTAIISNTLNLKAQITTTRDITAVEELKKKTDLPENWIETYFEEVTLSVLSDPINAIKNDTKIGPIKNVEFHIMQIELWDSREFIQKNKSLVEDLLRNTQCKNSFLTSPSISEGRNYIITLNDEVKTALTKTINATFTENIGITDKLWLRKEIIRELSK